MNDAPLIYHMRPPRLLGDSLLPLNWLIAAHPEFSEKLVSKYEGREAIPKRFMPELDCRWGDCVQFATVHPAKIRDAMARAAHDWPSKGVRFLAIRADRAVFTSANTTVWLYSNTEPTDFTTPKTDVVPYTSACVAKLGDLRTETETYFQKMKAAGRRPLLFVGVPHVLHRGAVPLDLCHEIIV